MSFSIKRLIRERSQTMKRVMLFSPGLDSYLANYLLMHSLKEEPLTRVYFDLCSRRYSLTEVNFLRKLYNKKYVKIDGRVFLGDLEHADAHIPNRNAVLCTLAQAVYDADVVYLNGVKCDRVSDNNSQFRKSMSRLLTKSAGKIVLVSSVLSSKEKVSWCKYYAEQVKSIDERMKLITNTFSCFTENENLSFKKIPVYEYDEYDDVYEELTDVEYPGCLRCDACFRKVCALTGANLYVDMPKPYKFREKFDPLLNDKTFCRKYPARTKSIKRYINFLNSD